MNKLVLALLLKLGLTTTSMAGGTVMDGAEEHVSIDVQGAMVIVSHRGTDLHRGVRIALGLGNGSLTFSGSKLAEHPDLIFARFAGDLSQFSHFSFSLADSETALLFAHIRMTKSDKKPRTITLGLIYQHELLKLSEALAEYGIRVLAE